MAFDPVEFAEFARELSGGSSAAEVHVRTACGRAYYAAFLVARSRLKAIGHQVLQRESIHRYVREALVNAKDDRLKGLGQNLGDLHRHRLNADYDLEPPYVAKSGFQPLTGQLLAAQARLWIDEFNAISRADLLSNCPP